MELNTEVRAVLVTNTLVATIVGVDEELFPFLRETHRINSVPVILGCNITST